MRSLEAIRAYQKSSTHRSFREQEADVFIHLNTSLRASKNADPMSRAKAVADNERLWIALMDIIGDPSNQLPEPLRASMLSVGHAVRREISAIEPDLAFLIGINEQIAAGLMKR